MSDDKLNGDEGRPSAKPSHPFDENAVNSHPRLSRNEVLTMLWKPTESIARTNFDDPGVAQQWCNDFDAALNAVNNIGWFAKVAGVEESRVAEIISQHDFPAIGDSDRAALADIQSGFGALSDSRPEVPAPKDAANEGPSIDDYDSYPEAGDSEPSIEDLGGADAGAPLFDPDEVDAALDGFGGDAPLPAPEPDRPDMGGDHGGAVDPSILDEAGYEGGMSQELAMADEGDQGPGDENPMEPDFGEMPEIKVPKEEGPSREQQEAMAQQYMDDMEDPYQQANVGGPTNALASLGARGVGLALGLGAGAANRARAAMPSPPPTPSIAEQPINPNYEMEVVRKSLLGTLDDKLEILVEEAADRGIGARLLAKKQGVHNLGEEKASGRFERDMERVKSALEELPAWTSVQDTLDQLKEMCESLPDTEDLVNEKLEAYPKKVLEEVNRGKDFEDEKTLGPEALEKFKEMIDNLSQSLKEMFLPKQQGPAPAMG